MPIRDQDSSQLDPAWAESRPNGTPATPRPEAANDRVNPAVKRAMAYLLRKNAELYRRLAE